MEFFNKRKELTMGYRPTIPNRSLDKAQAVINAIIELKGDKIGDFTFLSSDLYDLFESTGVSWTLQTLAALGLAKIKRKSRTTECTISHDLWNQIVQMTKTTDKVADSQATVTVAKINEINVRRVRVKMDPSIDIFPTTISYVGNGTWNETFKDEHELLSFERGMKCALAGGLLPSFEIPSTAEEYHEGM